VDLERLRALCLGLPGVTEHTIWEGDLTFKVGGKMFAHTALEPGPVWLSFKASPEDFAELTERSNVIPAPYLARAQWVALETRDALGAQELEQLIRTAHELVVARLPRKAREALARDSAKPPAKRKNASTKRRKRSSKRSVSKR
jgi:predicted DNA-binding protein (MmcQ/YjbR family)